MTRQPQHTATLATLFLALGMMQASAQETATLYNCEMNGIIRGVELRENPTGQPVCEVWYDKSQEGAGRSLLWTASNDAAYCRDQAMAFLDKLAGWGWSCSAADITATEESGN